MESYFFNFLYQLPKLPLSARTEYTNKRYKSYTNKTVFNSQGEEVSTFLLIISI